MSVMDEFNRWLRRPERTFTENLHFGINAWQSGDLTLTSKYELVLSWLTDELKTYIEKPTVDFPFMKFKELLQSRGQPGLVSQDVKVEFIKQIVKFSKSWKHNVDEEPSRLICEFLLWVSECEVLQDIFRSNHLLQAKLFKSFLQQYANYLKRFLPKSEEHINTTNQKIIRPVFETDFFSGFCQLLKDTFNRAVGSESYSESYTSHILQPFTELILIFRTHSACFFSDLLTMEHLIYESWSHNLLLERIVELPLHTSLLVIECAIVNRRGEQEFIKLLLENIFLRFVKSDTTLDPALSLTMAAYTLEMLRKHDIELLFYVDEKRTTAIQYLGECIMTCVICAKDNSLREVLLLLCAALRLNPLILQLHIFKITTCIMLTTKQNNTEEQKLFEEYLILLMDMFRKLSRAEKFVINLLKSVNDWLQNNVIKSSLIEGKLSKREATKSALSPKRRKINETLDNERFDNSNTQITYDIFFLNILFDEFYKSNEIGSKQIKVCYAINSFPKLHYIWPSSTAGTAFSKLITSLVSKPSLVIWKSLLYSLKTLLENVANEEDLNENALFHIDLHSALICQYFAGAKLAEQAEKILEELTDQRLLTSEVFSQFGRFVLKHSESKGLLDGFLECSFYYANFELILGFYLPDGLMDNNLEKKTVVKGLHGFINEMEWSEIQQHVLKSNIPNTKFLLSRLQFQRQKAKFLLIKSSIKNSKITIDEEVITTSNSNELQQVLHSPNAKWMIANLNREQKSRMFVEVLDDIELLCQFKDDMESLNLILITIYERLCEVSSKKSLLGTLKCDFDGLRQNYLSKDDIESLIEQLVEAFKEYVAQENVVKVKKKENVEQALSTLKQLPIGFLRNPLKSLIFVLHLSFYRDLKAATEVEFADKAFEILTDLLHFGQSVPIHKFFPINIIMNVLPVESCWELYEFLFSSMHNDVEVMEEFISSVLKSIKNDYKHNKSLSNDHRRLLLITISTLSELQHSNKNRMKKYLHNALEIYGEYVTTFFNEKSNETSKIVKKFVGKTLPGFSQYVNLLLIKSAGSTLIGKDKKPIETNPSAEGIDENFRKICKVYIGHSMDYRNPNAIKLMSIALNNRQQLHLDQDEIEFVFKGYWNQINEDLTGDAITAPTTESVIKLIISFKTDEDFLLTLKNIDEIADDANKFPIVINILKLISKCKFNTIKGAIFNEKFKQITCRLVMRLERNDELLYKNNDLILDILSCHQSFAGNKFIPMSYDSLDCLLSFIININIKKFPIKDTNSKEFCRLHSSISDLCLILIKQRSILLMDRVPQFLHIFKDLLQSIIWYKSEREMDVKLDSMEIEELGELATKLEAIMHVITSHSIDFQRVASFVLIFIVNLMVAKRATTLYLKIKTHIESICYDLISICDYRVGGFILRCLGDAGRQVYEQIVKDYEKHHKFKGKV